MLRKFLKRPDLDQRRKRYLFVIGFNKTGTTSIHRLCQQSGYRSVHWDEGRLARAMLENVVSGRPVFHGYHHDYDVISDMVFMRQNFYFEGNTLFREMDADYPNAFFLYNTREIEGWLKSRQHHSHLVEGMTLLELHKKRLKTESISDVYDHWRRQRLSFEAELNSYFHCRENFLAIDIADAEFVEKLSAASGFFLNPQFWGKYNQRLGATFSSRD